MVVPHLRADTHALLTRPPLSPKTSFDLHVLSTPPAFILSQDQTLHCDLIHEANRKKTSDNQTVVKLFTEQCFLAGYQYPFFVSIQLHSSQEFMTRRKLSSLTRTLALSFQSIALSRFWRFIRRRRSVWRFTKVTPITKLMQLF